MDGDGGMLPWLRKCEKVRQILSLNSMIASNPV